MNSQEFLNAVKQDAFNDELNKLAGHGGTIMKAVKSVGQSFKNLGEAGKAVKSGVKKVYKASKQESFSKYKSGISRSKVDFKKAKGKLKGSGIAAGTIAGAGVVGTAGTAYAMNKKANINILKNVGKTVGESFKNLGKAGKALKDSHKKQVGKDKAMGYLKKSKAAGGTIVGAGAIGTYGASKY